MAPAQPLAVVKLRPGTVRPAQFLGGGLSLCPEQRRFDPVDLPLGAGVEVRRQDRHRSGQRRTDRVAELWVGAVTFSLRDNSSSSLHLGTDCAVPEGKRRN